MLSSIYVLYIGLNTCRFDPEKRPAVPREYDFFGAYGNERHKNYLYEERLVYDYTFDFPKHFPIIKQEAMACRNRVVAFDMSYFGKFYLTGNLIHYSAHALSIIMCTVFIGQNLVHSI